MVRRFVRTMLAPKRLAISALLLSLSPQGCAVSRDSMKDKLERSTQAYARAMRWGDWDAAANYVPAESAQAYTERGESLREAVTVVDRELLSLKYAPEKASAIVRYELSWQRDAEIVIQDTVLEETWTFFAGKWYLVEHERVSGEPLELMGDQGEPQEKRRRFADPLLPGRVAFLRARKKAADRAKKKPDSRKKKLAR